MRGMLQKINVININEYSLREIHLQHLSNYILVIYLQKHWTFSNLRVFNYLIHFVKDGEMYGILYLLFWSLVPIKWFLLNLYVIELIWIAEVIFSIMFLLVYL